MVYIWFENEKNRNKITNMNEIMRLKSWTYHCAGLKLDHISDLSPKKWTQGMVRLLVLGLAILQTGQGIYNPA